MRFMTNKKWITKFKKCISLSVLTLVSALLLCGCDISDYFDTVYTTDTIVSEGDGINLVTPEPHRDKKTETVGTKDSADFEDADFEGIETKHGQSVFPETNGDVQAALNGEETDEVSGDDSDAIKKDEGAPDSAYIPISEDQAYSNVEQEQEYQDYYFRSKKLLNQHYEKHGIEMGFASAEDYQQAASDVINNPDALSKTEKEDGDYVYYVEDTNEFVILSTDGYIRTYFLPDAGKKYYDKQ